MMRQKVKQFMGILLSLVMVIGMMPGMRLTVYANTYETGKLVIEKHFDIASWPLDDSPIDIPVIKTWNDNNNKDGNRPESVVVRLFADGMEIANAQMNADNNWRYVFTGLPRINENKEKINYTITEDPVEWYTAEINGFNIRNNYEPELTSATVTKIWDDANNEMQTRPESIVMTLSNGMTVLLNDLNNWTATVNDLPTRVNGAPADYTWTEQMVLGYDKVAEETEGTVTTFMNRSRIQSVTPVEGGTQWTAGDAESKTYSETTRDKFSAQNTYGNLNEYTVKQMGSPSGETPENIGLKETNTLRTADLALNVSLDAPEGANLSGLKLAIEGPDPLLNKTLTFEDVKDGNISLGKVLPGAYLIRDTNADTLVEGYMMDAANSKVSDAVYVASGASTRLEFKYTWKPREPINYMEVEDGYYPEDNIDNLTFEILGPDDRMPMTIKYSAFKYGKYELQDLKPGVYTVVERNAETLVKYYTLNSDSITGVAVEVKAGETVTAKLSNYYVAPKTNEEFVNIPVTKTWNDNNNADGNRPESVTVRLYADGVEVDSHVLTAAENWQFTFVEKPRYQDDNRTEITYTVGEDAVAMYTATVNGYNIVNDYRPEVMSVSVSKVWDDNNNKLNIRPDSIMMSLSDGQKVVKVVVLNEANGWTATVNNLPIVVNGQPAEYEWKEQHILGYSLEGVTQQGFLTIFTNKVFERPEIDLAVTTPVSTKTTIPYSAQNTEVNEDGSITTTITTYNADLSIIRKTIRKWENGKKTTGITLNNKSGELLVNAFEDVAFSKKGTKTVTTNITEANRYNYYNEVTTYNSGKETVITKITNADKSLSYAKMTTYPNGKVIRRSIETDPDGGSTITVGTYAVKTVSSGAPSQNSLLTGMDIAASIGFIGTFDTKGKDVDAKTIEAVEKLVSDTFDFTENVLPDNTEAVTEMIYKVTSDENAKLTKCRTIQNEITVSSRVTINYKSYKVYAVSKNAFEGCDTISKVTLGKAITTIGKKAFADLENLKEIVFNSKDKNGILIGKGAFTGITDDAQFFSKANKDARAKTARGILESGYGKAVTVLKK